GIQKAIRPKNIFWRKFLTFGAVLGFDFISLNVPLGTGWLHEEYHRAVLTRREMNSFNDINTFPIGKSIVYVRKVKDEDLIKLSDQYTPDFIRLQSAGIEAQYQQVQQLQKNNFFYNQSLPNIPLYWLITLNSALYVLNSSSPDEFDATLEEANKLEATDISKRDFTGPDFTAWVNSLYFPDRPYADRGPHPSGLGINRYIKPSALSDEEIQYLRKQGVLQFLNLLSPHLFGIAKIKVKSSPKGDHYGNFAVRHLLTSFGSDLSFDVFYQTPRNNLFFSLHNYRNLNAAFFGLEGALIDKPLFDRSLLFSGKAMVWSQPKDQSFASKEGAFGGLLSVRGAYPFGRWAPFVEVEGKTKGWVMGNVFLDENISLRGGLALRIK
ncbi:MAG: hypothetical protein ACK4NS_10825, partial [Saprospiraceae bacterium]